MQDVHPNIHTAAYGGLFEAPLSTLNLAAAAAQEKCAPSSLSAFAQEAMLPRVPLRDMFQYCVSQQQQQLQQQQQQQQQIMDVAALAASLLSLQRPNPGNAAAAHLHPNWQQQQQPILYNSMATAAWQLQAAAAQPAAAGLFNCQLSGQSTPPADAATSCISNVMQHTRFNLSQWPGCVQPSSSRSLSLSAMETQLQQLLHDFQIPIGGFGAGPPPSSTPMALNNNYSSLMSPASIAPAPAAAAVVPSPLELSLVSLTLQNNGSSSSSSSIASCSSGSPRRTSSLLDSSGSDNSSVSTWGSNAAIAAVAAAALAISSSEAEQTDDDGLSLVHNHFCRQEIGMALNATVTVLLSTLRSLQYADENPNPRQHRLYVCGLRESCKAIKSGKAMAVLLAPDIQLNKFGRPDSLLDGRMNDIIVNSSLPRPGCVPVPVVFALSRMKIGQVFGSKKRMSAIALLDVTGVEDLFGMMLQLAEDGRRRWAEMQNMSFSTALL